jgi:hypothetical protein
MRFDPVATAPGSVLSGASLAIKLSPFFSLDRVLTQSVGAGPSAIPAAMDPARSQLSKLEVTCGLYHLCHHVQYCL